MLDPAIAVLGGCSALTALVVCGILVSEDTWDKRRLMATMRLCADIEDVATIRQFVVQTSRDLAVDEKIIPDLELVADELCSNVINHGYDGQPGWIEITVRPIENGLQLTIRDWGQGFDPAAVPVPDLTAPLEKRALGGLGLFLVRRLMDDVQFETDGRNGNSVTVVKHAGIEKTS
jgi:serine/threonine-protein kinase RsbW